LRFFFRGWKKPKRFRSVAQRSFTAPVPCDLSLGIGSDAVESAQRHAIRRAHQASVTHQAVARGRRNGFHSGERRGCTGGMYRGRGTSPGHDLYELYRADSGDPPTRPVQKRGGESRSRRRSILPRTWNHQRAAESPCSRGLKLIVHPSRGRSNICRFKSRPKSVRTREWLEPLDPT